MGLFNQQMEESVSFDTLKVPSISYSSSLSPMSDTSYGSSSSDTEWAPIRGSPYQRRTKKSPEERKLRKMEQNKTAALRYRQKKHDESYMLHREREELQVNNEHLKKTASELSLELKYIKKLVKEVCQIQGLL